MPNGSWNSGTPDCPTKAARFNSPTPWSDEPQLGPMDKPEHLLEETKSTCEKLGCTQGTEKIGDCVLRLMNWLVGQPAKYFKRLIL